MAKVYVTDTDVLDLPMGENDANAATVREYLFSLLSQLWIEREGFSGKRPFGNSGWDYDLIAPLIKAGYIAGKLDEDGLIVDCDFMTGRQMIANAIAALAKGWGR